MFVNLGGDQFVADQVNGSATGILAVVPISYRRILDSICRQRGKRTHWYLLGGDRYGIVLDKGSSCPQVLA